MTCCAKFAEHTRKDNVGFEWDKGWHINGCCGGGCYVLTDIEFCPYCGSKLDPDRDTKTT